MKTVALVFAGIVVLGIVIGVTREFAQSFRSSPSRSLWEQRISGVVAEVNRDGTDPARAMLGVQKCETTVDCNAALQELSVVLKPYRRTLTRSIGRLSAIRPPGERGLFQDDYVRMLELRLKAVTLYISGAERLDYDTLAQGDEAWFDAIDASSDVIDRLPALMTEPTR